eukprot:CAMPEP_0195578088 /NCGR_PEP_ID=MMETSP0814-20130614/11503_1 /TAXON_ID=97485 /ORGANISM="Prymnesium parvum, Strain Texoma1" /LENGTH=85 /DNA_ID=CAMNT_0040714567 /DNA_START=460 /DNA_END=713 /DNA_ORIENTATION=-
MTSIIANKKLSCARHRCDSFPSESGACSSAEDLGVARAHVLHEERRVAWGFVRLIWLLVPPVLETRGLTALPAEQLHITYVDDAR